MIEHDEWCPKNGCRCGKCPCAGPPLCKPSDGPALDVWDNLPPHLQEALREALEGLSEAFEDVSHPLSSHLQRLWDVTDEIEAYILAREKEVSAPRE